MQYRFVTCDVFSARRYAGNQLAVLPDARGLTSAQMQAIAAEFNYSETSFVLPPADPTHLAAVRIFTPRAEIPFAGHPTLGTALALVWEGMAPAEGEIVLEELAGPVAVRLSTAGAELTAPTAGEHGEPLPPAGIAAALGLAETDLVTTGGLPCLASAGTPFLLVELASLAALGRARLAGELPVAGSNGVFLITRASGDPAIDLRARMYAPLHGIAEDPATGSAAAALAGVLGAAPGLAEGWHGWSIAQGIEMGRPSLLHARARRSGGRVTEIRVGGQAVKVAAGSIEVDA